MCGQIRSDTVRLTEHSALTSTYAPHQVRYSNVCVVRDEEAAGSNPATPTGKRQVTKQIVTCPLHYTFPGARFGSQLEAGNGQRKVPTGPHPPVPGSPALVCPLRCRIQPYLIKAAPAAPLARRQRRPLALGGPARRTPGHALAARRSRQLTRHTLLGAKPSSSSPIAQLADIASRAAMGPVSCGRRQRP